MSLGAFAQAEDCNGDCALLGGTEQHAMIVSCQIAFGNICPVFPPKDGHIQNMSEPSLEQSLVFAK
eukprot:6002741-Amphidinium_carterae.1